MTVIAAGKFGLPWHGPVYNEGAGNQLHLPNGGVMDYPYVVPVSVTSLKLQAPDAPAAPATSEAEVAQGKAWRNYLVYPALANSLVNTTESTLVIGGVTRTVLAQWYWMPTFGKVYKCYLLRMASHPTFSGYRQHAIYTRRMGEEGALPRLALLDTDYLSLISNDVADGDGSRLLLGVQVFTGSARSTHHQGYEYTLTDGDPPAAARVAVGGNVYVSTTAGLNTDRILGVDQVQVIESSDGPYPCEDENLTYNVWVGDTQPRAPGGTFSDEYYYQFVGGSWQVRYYESQTRDGLSVTERIVAALYIGGVASVVSLRNESQVDTVYTFDREYDYRNEEYKDPGACAVLDNVISNTLYDRIIKTITSVKNQTLRINGSAVLTDNSGGTEVVTETVTWTQNFGVGTEIERYRIDTSQDAYYGISRSTETTGSAATGATLAPALKTTLHPIIHDPVSDFTIHPGGSESGWDGSGYPNYDPTTATISPSATPMIWI